MDREAEQPDGSRHGPGFVALSASEDHWDEMSVEERDWCSMSSFRDLAAYPISGARSSRCSGSYGCDRPCALVVSLLFGKTLTEDECCASGRLSRQLSRTPSRRCGWYMTWGIDRQF